MKKPRKSRQAKTYIRASVHFLLSSTGRRAKRTCILVPMSKKLKSRAKCGEEEKSGFKKSRWKPVPRVSGKALQNMEEIHMKKIITKCLICLSSLLFTLTCLTITVKANDEYEFMEQFAEIYESIEDQNPYVQVQVSRATIVNGKINVNSGDGQCNASSLTTLLNRRLAYDGLYSKANKFRINEVFSANGVTLKYDDMKKAETGQKGYNCYVFSNNKDTGGWAKTGKKYTNSNGTATYKIHRIGSDEWKNKSNNPYGIKDLNEYAVYLLMQHPEGVCVRSKTANHVVVLVNYKRDKNGKIQFYIKDPATSHGSHEDTKKIQKSWFGDHGGSTDDGGLDESGFNFFAYLEGSKAVDLCGGNHTAEYNDRTICKCARCGHYNYKTDNSIAVKNGVYVIIPEGTQLREGPYNNDTSATVENLPGGAEVTVDRAVENIFGNTWYKVSYGNKTGFVFHSKLLYSGPENPFKFGSYKKQLKSGSKGNDVKFLQQALNIVIGADLKVDGDFGTKTKSAVKTFQKKYSLTQDGIYGAKSNEKMESVLVSLGYSKDGKSRPQNQAVEGKPESSNNTETSKDSNEQETERAHSSGGGRHDNISSAKSPYDYGSYSRQLQYKSSMMRGDDVKYLQQALNIVMNSGLDVDGIFGAKTKDAVKNFQRKYNLEVDGIFGKNSNKKMEEILRDLGY